MTRALLIASIGESMIELARSSLGPFSYDRRYGGDTLNTAVYLARLLRPEVASVQYVTRLGDDSLSDWMIAGFKSEALDCSLIARVKDRRPGLYIIDTDARGERSFSYWRSEAPARQLFEDDDLASRIDTADAVYTSGITLAILSDRGRERLIALMQSLKSQGRVAAFDTNYRARLWPSPQAAASWMRQAIAASTHLLPSSDDLEHLFGEEPAPAAWIGKLAGLRAGEIVVKTAGGPVHTSEASLDLPKHEAPRDTTGAGDSFNAGYLAARLTGHSIAASVGRAHALASRVIQYPGAVIAREKMIDLMS